MLHKDELVNYNSIYENFEIFWKKYPKKVWKKPCQTKFKYIKDFKNLFLWLDLYCKKWEIEGTLQQHIPNPLTFLNQERYYDEIIIDESKKEKNKKLLQEIKEEKKEQEEIRNAQEKRKELIIYYNSLSEEKRKEIQKEAENIIQKQNPVLFEKKGLFYDNYKKIIIRSILAKLIK